jgi:hypothetical protein
VGELAPVVTTATQNPSPAAGLVLIRTPIEVIPVATLEADPARYGTAMG